MDILNVMGDPHRKSCSSVMIGLRRVGMSAVLSMQSALRPRPIRESGYAYDGPITHCPVLRSCTPARTYLQFGRCRGSRWSRLPISC